MPLSSERKGRALLCVHDVTPGGLRFLADVLRDVAARGVPAANLAVVPRFHDREEWRDAAAFRGAIAGAGPGIRTEIMLHGCFHLRVGENERLSWPRRFRSRLQSDREDEFYRLGRSAAEARVRTGARILSGVFGRTPAAFVPPAWAGSAELRDVLRGLGFRATEDHFWIHDLSGARRIFSPVIAFSTRSPRRERLSKLWAGLVMRGPARRSPLRFVLHPGDYRSPATRGFALDLVEAISRTHEWVLAGELQGSRNDRS
jgi:predicted deacetylase